MKIILSDENTYVLRFDKGEEIIAGLTAFAAEREITAGVFSVIGACREIILAYYHLEDKTYQDKTLYEDMEIVSVTGNIGQMNDKVMIHAHGVVSDIDLETHGGHIKKLVISATGEVILQVLKGKLTRTFDPDTGLNLLS